ncbi:hypothetical protein [Aggregatibacter actinomycetemcomitans]|uniref:hypothetical protein n=1 Tax=Aggregatibacter actinomycetemcomitans TaxID=714 RepID=UPI001E452EFD|nr:hypothetical protein [Aggregatibacter actinomycetemcomitans]
MSNNTSPNYITYSLELLIKISEYGDANVQKMLGWHYENGVGVAISYKDALEWYGKAAR